MSKYSRILVFVSLILLVTVMVPNALAYFSTYTQTKGMKIVTIGDESQIEEREVKKGIKPIIISADAGSLPIFVRVKAIHVSSITTKKVDEASEDYAPSKWKQSDDGYYYYSDALDGVEGGYDQSATLLLKVNIPSTLVAENGDEIHVVVVYEAIPAKGTTNDPSLWTAENTQIVGGNS